MTPIVHALRSSLTPLFAIVLAVGGAVAIAFANRPAPVIVTVPIAITAPAAAPAVVTVPPSWCWGDSWRYSSVDLRPFCGWR